MKNSKLLIVFLSVSLTCFMAKAVEVSPPKDSQKVKVEEVCVNGLSYVVVVTGQGGHRMRGVALVQVFVAGKHNTHEPQPKSCAKLNQTEG